MNTFAVKKIKDEHIGKWSYLWEKNLSEIDWLIRSHNVEYYRYRYINNAYNSAYLYTDDDNNEIAFCGISTRYMITNNEIFKAAEFCDFIINPEFKEKGYTIEFLNNLINNELKKYDEIFFFPYDRNAYITWKMMVPLKKIYELHTWYILLNFEKKNLDSNIIIKEANTIPFEINNLLNKSISDFIIYKKNRNYLQWRYMNYIEKYYFFIIEINNETVGYFTYKILNRLNIYGIEIGDIFIDPQCDYPLFNMTLDNIINFLNHKNFNFISVKVMQDNIYDTFFKNWSKSKSSCNKMYLLSVDNGKDIIIHDSKKWHFIGEDLDIPRTGTSIEKFIIN